MRNTNPPEWLLLDFFQEHFRPLFLRGRSPQTIALYLISLRSFSKFLCRPPRLSDLNDSTVNRYLCHFRELPRRPATVNKERSNLTAIWRFACRKGFLTIWPDVPKDVEPDTIPVAWMPDELSRLFSAAARMPGNVGRVESRLWWPALLLVCWDSGERITAVLSLRWSDVDLVRGWMVSPAGSRKGGRSDEAYRLHPDTVAALSAIRGPGNDVFRWPYHPTYIWARFDKLLVAAGLPHDRRSKFHRIRRSVGSYVKAAGGDPTEVLRHRDSRVTKAYLDPRIVLAEQAVDFLFRPGGRPAERPRQRPA